VVNPTGQRGFSATTNAEMTTAIEPLVNAYIAQQIDNNQSAELCALINMKDRSLPALQECRRGSPNSLNTKGPR
jgi:hypothetical protein